MFKEYSERSSDPQSLWDVGCPFGQLIDEHVSLEVDREHLGKDRGITTALMIKAIGLYMTFLGWQMEKKMRETDIVLKKLREGETLLRIAREAKEKPSEKVGGGSQGAGEVGEGTNGIGVTAKEVGGFCSRGQVHP
ncbi:hypothetical protein E2542_SST04455 [Spatholobus suberectus]|nr:hypothetical protein E2542_SST04455 [Spatholobus suberectus]